MTPQELINKIKNDIDSKKQVAVINGFYGDLTNCNAILESVYQPPEGGTYFTAYGCSIPFKGFPETPVVEGLGLAKAIISAFPREFIAKYIPAQILAVWMLLFSRKKFIHLARVAFSAIYVNEVIKINIPQDKYCKMIREMKRVINEVLDEIGKERNYDLKSFSYLHGDFAVQNEKEFFELIALAVEFVFLFIELDSAYRFRIQDSIELLDKRKVQENVVKEIMRVLDVMIARENPVCGITHKIQGAKKLIWLILTFDKEARDFARRFLLKLDLEKAGLDSDDWYFCLAREGHDFRGIPLAERVKEKERIDREKGHIILKVNPAPNGIEIGV